MADDRPGMTFDAYKDRILLALGTLLIAWLGYLTSAYISLPHIHSDAEIATMIIDRSPYAHDKDLINDRFQRLWEERQKGATAQERLVEELTTLRIQVERLLSALSEQQKLMGNRSNPNPNPNDSPGALPR